MFTMMKEVVSAIQSTIEVLSTNENIDVEVPWETNEANQSMLVSSIDSSWSRVYVKVNMNREDSKVLLKDIYQDIELPSSAPEEWKNTSQIIWRLTSPSIWFSKKSF